LESGSTILRVIVWTSRTPSSSLVTNQRLSNFAISPISNPHISTPLFDFRSARSASVGALFVVGIGDGTASVMNVIRYAYLDGKPVRLNDREAWWLVDGVWKALHPADAGNDAKLVSEEQFNSMFPGLPQLPSTAFQRH
jgi:hypothetical protein